jgi:hypothetical protein
MVIVCTVLALGRHTPLYPLMYKFVPKYDSFRGTVKFAMFAVAFASMLAALGWDRLFTLERNGRAVWSIVMIAIALAIAMFAVVVGVSGKSSERGVWPNILKTIVSSSTQADNNELFSGLPPEKYRDADFVNQTARSATTKLAISALTCAAAAVLVWSMRLAPQMAFGLIALAGIELFLFARFTRATTNPQLTMPQPWQDALVSAPQDTRVLIPNPQHMDSGMYFGFDHIWGYDPGVLKRYAELLTYSQGFDPAEAKQYLQFRGVHRNIFRALRCRYVFLDPPNQPVMPLAEPLPTLALVRDYFVSSDRGAILTMFSSNTFDPRWTALLERVPDPLPAKGDSLGNATLVRRSTDELEIRIETDSPAILLVTENFAHGWRARSLLPAPPQARYQIQSADWALQAIPLGAGSHHFLLEYKPTSFVIGRWISALSLLAATSVFLWRWWRTRYAAADSGSSSAEAAE